MEISLGDFRSSRDIWEFPVQDFSVLARPDVPGLYILNGSARLIWDALRAGAPFAALVREFVSKYGVRPELAARDVRRTFRDWRSGLLSPEATTTSSITAPAIAGQSKKPWVLAGDYLIHGKNVRVILQTSELAEEIGPRLESLPHARSGPDFTFRVVEERDGFRIFRDECCVVSEQGIGETRVRLLQEIVGSCRGREFLAVFHAGACGSNSRCVIFPAGTQSGKTTLAAVLMKTGLTFYGDDSVLLERDTFSVPAMPFALTIREGSWDVLSPRFPEFQAAPIVSRYGQRVRFLAPLETKRHGHCKQVGAIVFVQFDPDAANEINPLDTLGTLLRLQQSGFWVAHDEKSIRAFLGWLESTPSFSMNYSDVDWAASAIGRLIE
jgi:Coenzyme PQQ synthesis protein D (PqqD)